MCCATVINYTPIVMGNGMNKVITGLFIGNVRDSKDVQQLQTNRITHIVSIHDNARQLHQDKEYLCIKASDCPDQNLTQYFAQCNDFIHKARSNGGNVLIHCLAGVSRSVTVAAAYIMSSTSLNARDAIKAVRAVRSVANPNFGFEKQLRNFERGQVTEERKRLKKRYPGISQEQDEDECHKLIGIFHTSLQQSPRKTSSICST